MKRLLILSFFLVAGLWAAAGVVPWDLPSGVTRADLKACRETPDADCVLDIGTALLLNRKELTVDDRWLAPLAMSGRIEAAEAVIAHHAERRGTPPDDASAEARTETLRFRLARDLRAGVDLDAALAEVPDADGGDLWIVGLELLHKNPYGLAYLGAPKTPTESERDLVTALASRILAWNDAQPPRARDFQLSYAAELRAALGDRKGTIDALRAMNARNVRAPGLSTEVFRVAGPETVLALVDPSDRVFANLLQRAGEAEEDPDLAAQHFTRAFDLYAGDTPWPDFDLMLRIVKATLKRGLASEARVLADRMVQLADENSDVPFHVFDRLHAAQALRDAGAAPDAVSEQIDIAISQFPSDGSEIVGFGLVSGLMRWEPSGLADNARASIAGLTAEIGDIETALAVLDQVADPVTAWTKLTDRDLPVATLETLREAASQKLSAEDSAFVAARLAHMAVVYRRGADHEAWALRVAKDLGNDPQAMKARDGAVAEAVARIAFDQGDEVLGRAALEALARIALDRRDGVQLIRTGYMTASARP